MEKVIFDTNILRNTEPKNFLGGRDELKKFSEVAEIIFPDIVIEELKCQKRKQLEKHKKSFLDNPFHWLIKINKQDTENFDNEAFILDLENKEEIKYSLIKLQDYSVLEKIKELALKKLPPFESGDNTDKGFKDTYIYFTILEYLQIAPDKHVFVCTKDGRLKEALKKHLNIKVVEDFEDFEKHSITSFYDEYFINKLKDSVHLDITRDNIVDFWFGVDENQFLLIEVEDEKLVIEIDQREIVSSIKYNSIKGYIENLIISDNWKNTHDMCRKILPNIRYVIPTDSKELFKALLKNDQIYGTYGYSVQEFYSKLFKIHYYLLDKDDLEKIKNKFKLQYNTD
jgi:rRNA-processing protein FCF1